ncbi:hypothetical protein AB0M61_47405 [Streptomyces sp. NPDC051642]|uniref:hypothetical protein n=1 Tax=Streptomyces sp. NPDC051642 TaxID=3154646 RepID=UPI00341AC1FB
MNVEIQPDVRESATRLGAGVPYALKVVARQLADDPDMGTPSELPGILTVTVDGELFEDCPALSIGYIREPDRIEIRYLRPAQSATPSTTTPDRDQDRGDQVRPADPAAAAITVREVADAWYRITTWLGSNAPDSCAALRAGAGPAAIAALEGSIGVEIPVELHVLWLLTGGDDGVNGWGWGCLPGGEALMTLDAVAAEYRMKMDAQAHEDTLNAARAEDDRTTVWKTTWVPVVSHGAADATSGLYLDVATGHLGRWSRYNESRGGELDTVVTYLEETADMLETPALATRDKPGLIGGALVWRRRLSPSLKDQWQPLTG